MSVTLHLLENALFFIKAMVRMRCQKFLQLRAVSLVVFDQKVASKCVPQKEKQDLLGHRLL